MKRYFPQDRVSRLDRRSANRQHDSTYQQNEPNVGCKAVECHHPALSGLKVARDDQRIGLDGNLHSSHHKLLPIKWLPTNLI